MVAERIVHPEAEYSAPVVSPPMPPRAWRWTKEQYRQLGEDGYFRDRRVELIEGEIIEMAAMNAPHWKSCLLLRNALQAVFDEGYVVTDQLPISILGESEPQPDVAVIAGQVRDFETLPSIAALAIEVSNSTLKYDQDRKLKLYARAGIAEYWILDLNARRLLVHRQPNAENELYKSVQILTGDDEIAPLEASNAAIKVADLLP